jgi:hypothetical protein
MRGRKDIPVRLQYKGFCGNRGLPTTPSCTHGPLRISGDQIKRISGECFIGISAGYTRCPRCKCPSFFPDLLYISITTTESKLLAPPTRIHRSRLVLAHLHGKRSQPWLYLWDEERAEIVSSFLGVPRRQGTFDSVGKCFPLI